MATDKIRVRVTFTRPSWKARGLAPRVNEIAGPREFVRDVLSTSFRGDVEILSTVEVPA